MLEHLQGRSSLFPKCKYVHIENQEIKIVILKIENISDSLRGLSGLFQTLTLVTSRKDTYA